MINEEQFDTVLFDEEECEPEYYDNNVLTSETLRLADGNLINNLAVLDALSPPAPVFINEPTTQSNKAIYFSDYKLLRDFVRSNKDLSDQYFIILPASHFGSLRYDPRQRLKSAILYKRELIK